MRFWDDVTSKDLRSLLSHPNYYQGNGAGPFPSLQSGLSHSLGTDWSWGPFCIRALGLAAVALRGRANGCSRLSIKQQSGDSAPAGRSNWMTYFEPVFSQCSFHLDLCVLWMTWCCASKPLERKPAFSLSSCAALCPIRSPETWPSAAARRRAHCSARGSAATGRRCLSEPLLGSVSM